MTITILSPLSWTTMDNVASQRLVLVSRHSLILRLYYASMTDHGCKSNDHDTLRLRHRVVFF